MFSKGSFELYLLGNKCKIEYQVDLKIQHLDKNPLLPQDQQGLL